MPRSAPKRPAPPAHTPRVSTAVVQADSALSDRQRAFVEAYTTPGGPGFGNQVRAAVEAGYALTTAKAQAHRLLAIVGVRAAIDARFEETGMKHAEVRARIGEIARFDPSAFVVFDEYLTSVDRPTPIAEAARLARLDHARAIKAEQRMPRVRADQMKARLDHLDALDFRAVELELQAEDEPDAVVMWPHREIRRVPRLDLAAAADAGVLHLVEGFRLDQWGRLTPEMPDRLDALKHLDKMATLAQAGGDGASGAAAGLAAALNAMGLPSIVAGTVNVQINHAPVGAQTP